MSLDMTISPEFKRLKAGFAAKAYDALGGGVIYVDGSSNQRSVAGDVSSDLRSLFNLKKRDWKIYTPAMDNEYMGPLESHSRPGLNPTERTTSMMKATREQVIDYLAGREALRHMVEMETALRHDNLRPEPGA